MQNIWSFIEEMLLRREPVVLIVVSEVRGSSPGKKGFKMAISTQGKKAGSIGGGPMEYSLEKFAMESLQTTQPKAFTKRQVHSPDAGREASGLICAGEQHHVFVKLFPEDIITIRDITASSEKGMPGRLVLSPQGIQFLEPPDNTHAVLSKHPEGVWRYEEVLLPEPVLYIFGGGHVSVPVTSIARVLGFRAEVYDDRKGLITMEENTAANHREVIGYEQAANVIKSPASSYVCIMTVAHTSDQLILEQLLPLPLRYLGMIGSKKKVKTIFSNLLAKGADPAALERVDAPMGMAINSETPAEIAVSITAEIIRRKNQSSSH